MEGAGHRVVFDADGLCVGVLVRDFVINVSVDKREVYSFDLSGRLHSAFDGAHHFRRALNGRILEAFRHEKQPRERWFAAQESAIFLDRIHRRMADLLGGQNKTQHMAWVNGQIAGWNVQKYAEDVAKFEAVYRPVSILPPDQYMSVVVQATLGCSWNRCHFCDFYQDRPFHIRSRQELDRHIAEVRAFLGEGLAMRRSIFIGDANALSVSWPDVNMMFEAIQAGFPEDGNGPTWRDIYVFADVFGGQKRTVSEIEYLKNMGLRRVYMGLETGCDALLRHVNKRGSADLAVDVVGRFKKAGVSVGLIVLLGLGGVRYAKDQVKETIKMFNRMPLDQGDVIYFSPLVTYPHLPYTQDKENRPFLNSEALCAQQQEIKNALFEGEKNKPRMAHYSISRFVY